MPPVSRKRAPEPAQLSEETIAFNAELLEALAATTLSRAALIQKLSGDQRRSLIDECGFILGSPTAQQYQERFDRNPAAARGVRAWVNECWQVLPEVFDDHDENVETEFESAIKELGQTLRKNYRASGFGESWNRQQNINPIWSYLRKLDELSGIGSYGVMLFGLDDATTDLGLKQPVDTSEPREIRYLRVFSESHAEIVSYEQNPNSPRFGLPAVYRITVNDEREPHAGAGLVAAKVEVHWSRVLHVSDDWLQAGASEVYAPPRMRTFINNIDGLDKIWGASPEGYYKSCFTGLAFETHANTPGAKINIPALREQMEAFQNSLQKVLAAAGGTWKTLAPSVVDPKPHIDAQLQAVAIALDMPMRILMGTERGELGSSQDERRWNRKVASRQNGYATPGLIVPFFDRCIAFGALPKPRNEEYFVDWPELTTNDPKDIAANALTYTQALAQYVTSDGESQMPAMEYWMTVWKMTKQEAELIVKAGERVMEEREEEMEKMLEEQGGVLPAPGAKPPNGKPQVGRTPAGRQPTRPPIPSVTGRE